TSTGESVPGYRAGASAVWSGTEMIVWGGSEDAAGGRYNPATDSWSASTGTGAPLARNRHSAVWTGNEMIVWGGYTTVSPYDRVNSGGRYNPASDSWAPTSTGANVPTPRRGHTAVWTGAEMII